jgi:hypothetical protein
MQYPVCNGFKIRALNADCDKLAVQSNVQTTWLLGRGNKARGPRGKWYDVGLAQSELCVLRPYGGTPEFEIAPLGETGAVLLLELTRQQIRRTVRVGARITVMADRDEACVVRVERMMTPVGPLDMSPEAQGLLHPA